MGKRVMNCVGSGVKRLVGLGVAIGLMVFAAAGCGGELTVSHPTPEEPMVLKIWGVHRG